MTSLPFDGPGPRSVQATAGQSLLGRDDECRRITRLLEDARARSSSALVLSGEPGIGKSALCAWAVAQARGFRLMSAGGVESEVDLPFAGLAELSSGVLELIGQLPKPQARALDGALARRDAPRADRFAIGAAVLSLFAVAGRGEPVLITVDDAQWLDGSSADAILFAARRLRHESAAMVMATRPGSVFDDARTALPRLDVDGLDRDACRVLLRTAHGALPEHVAAALAERCEGNPLALLELPRLLTDAQLAGEEPIDEPLPLAPTLARALLERQSGLPATTRRALLLAAANSGDRVQAVIDAVRSWGLERTVLDPAERAGVLAIRGGRVEFRHPLLRSAIYHGATSPERRAAHAAMAAVTHGEAQAWHLAQATVGEDETVAATLERIGLDARRRGALAAASAALERAARLSEPGARRASRLTAAAHDAHLAGQSATAVRLLDDALFDAQDPLQHADVQHLRGRILVAQGQSEFAYRVLVDEAALVRELDSARAATMLAEACLHCLLDLNLASAVAAARQACSAATRADPSVQAYTTVMLAAALVFTGERVEAGALLDALLPVLRSADPLAEAGELVSLAAQCYFWLDRYDVASELLARQIAAARRASAPTALLWPLSCRAELELRAGRWTVAEAQLDEVARLGELMARPLMTAYALECLACLAARAGDERRCREHAARARALVDEHHNQLGRLYVHSAVGLLELGLGRAEDAIQTLESARALAREHGLAEPNIVHWQADLVEAQIRAGETAAAHQALDAFDRQAEHTGGRWALGTAARCRGLLAPSPDADAHFAAALEHLQQIPAAFEIARTHLCHGERLRRAGRRTDARRALRAAIEAFDWLGAHPWTERAHAELRASGEHLRRPLRASDSNELTPHEVQVAVVVANGATNREAAAALFLSPKTIEFHLAHIYRKLGVRTRTELAGVAARRGWLDSSTPIEAAGQH